MVKFSQARKDTNRKANMFIKKNLFCLLLIPTVRVIPQHAVCVCV